MARKTREERRQELMNAARDVFVERGFQAATIDDIVARAKVARGTFYLYFGDKKVVFEALVDAFLVSVSECVKSIDLSPEADPPRIQLRDNIRRFVGLCLGEPAIVKLALHDANGLDPQLDEKLRAYYGALRALIDESLEQGQALGMVRSGDRAMMVAIGLGGLREVMLDAVSGEVSPDAAALTDEIMRFLEQGLLLDAG